ncbi:MoaD/ThiS family protein [Microbacterium sp. M28]|uniref:MoaD/ThiS family protein n=1 Tax=Microbacterium sp. M28 TaxID=2962064 RepID=UPI0021F47177|nr:MoaD/ThiS family protein [Microbacterium sp. M28]UYO95882.1 MoaD/ThiS family protein [Microbacterium sp. M28]
MRVRFFAAAAEAAGREEQQITTDLTLGDLLAQLRVEHGAEFARVLDRCAIRVDGATVDQRHPIAATATVDVLPPFAGG